MKFSKFAVFVALFSLFAIFSLSLADGIIIPYPPMPPYPPTPPHPEREPFQLSIKYHDVEVTIEDGVVRTHVEEVFVNDHDVELEGTYIFPLPEGAAIDEFAMYVDGEKIYAEVMDADEARQIYEDYVREMKDPALLEYYGKDAFRARVYPIPANGEKKIEISYSEVLKPDAGVYKYVYPLEISNFTKDPLERLKIDLELKSSQPLLNIYCPTYSVDIDREGKTLAAAHLEDEDVKPDKDFVLYYQVAQDDLGLSLLSYKEWGEDGYFILNMMPRFDLETEERSKDIVFVFDTSGSMRGDKIEQTKSAMEYCLKSLNPGDYFSIVSFSSEVKTFSDRMLPANDENIDNALEFIKTKEARGGTNIHSAILTAEELLGSYSPDLPLIVFLTDGKPTVGTTDEEEMIGDFTMANDADSRIFVFGVGYDLNATLLDHIAKELSGVTQYVGEGENLEVAVSNFYDKIDSPVYSDIEIDFGGVDVYKTTPKPLPDMFKGTQLVMAGRYEGEGMTTITVSAEGPKGEEVHEYPVDFDGDSEAVVSTIWARRWIGYLLEEMRVEGEEDELIEEVKRLALEYGIVTPYTSMFIQEQTGADINRIVSGVSGADEDTMDMMAPMMREMEAGGLGGGPMTSEESIKYMLKKGTDKSGVTISKDIQSTKEGTVEYESEVVKTVEGRTFYLKEDDIWTDSRYDEDAMSLTEIEFGSDEYFNFLSTNPKLAEYTSVGLEVIVVLSDTEAVKIYTTEG